MQTVPMLKPIWLETGWYRSTHYEKYAVAITSSDILYME